MTLENIKKQILALVDTYATELYTPKTFVPGQSHVPVSGKVLGANELQHLVEASLDAWLTTGRFNDLFEKKLGEFLGARFVLTVNSGSSANLLAFAALTSHELGDKALKAGDEVLTVATGFPTTVNPMLLYGMVPVFVDAHIPTYNGDVSQLEAAITSKTRAIMMAHTLGNPFDLARVKALADKHDLWLIEDCCDALGSTYQGQMVGSFGHIGTLSFYPAHHITMGEGGAVFTNNGKLKKIMESIRDWGRDCWCAPGKDNTCGKRFDWQLGELPHGFDHKYTYSHLGYNLKISDMQAAVGVAQLERLPEFVQRRKDNFKFLKQQLSACPHLILPEATAGSDPSWFGFPITIAEGAPFERLDLLKYLDEAKIGTRLIFGGNLLRQPYMQGRQYRVHGALIASDTIMNRAFWIGLYPGLTQEMLTYLAEKISQFMRRPVAMKA